MSALPLTSAMPKMKVQAMPSRSHSKRFPRQDQRAGGRRQPFAQVERRHGLRPRLADQIRGQDQLETRCAQSVDDARQRFDRVAAIAATVVQQDDVAHALLLACSTTRA